MKGPYERLKYDLRRVWECPQCQGRQRTDGTVTGLVCNCQQAVVENERVSMRLLRDDIRRSSVKQPQPSAPAASPSDNESPASEAPPADVSADHPASSESSDEQSTTETPAEPETATAENNAAAQTGEQSPENTEPSENSNDTAGPG